MLARITVDGGHGPVLGPGHHAACTVLGRQAGTHVVDAELLQPADVNAPELALRLADLCHATRQRLLGHERHHTAIAGAAEQDLRVVFI